MTTTTTTTTNTVPLIYYYYYLGKYSFWIGWMIRWLLAWWGPLFLDHSNVPYTDMDYRIFTDAATYIQNGQSPYQRSTYRYTPFLAFFLAQLPFFKISSRLVFCFADALCGWYISYHRQCQRQRQQRQQPQQQNQQQQDFEKEAWNLFQDALFWQYNPLAINICTRGSAESLLVLVPVLSTLGLVEFFQQQQRRQQQQQPSSMWIPLWMIVSLAGMAHGIAVHAKLYPIIYTLSHLIAIAQPPPPPNTTTTTHGPWLPKQQQQQQPPPWILVSLCKPLPILFGLISALTFLASTWASVYFYGPMAWEEGFLYHFSRMDHRHNYSMHWYWLYLAKAAAAPLPLPSFLLFVPQIILLVYTALILAPHHLTLALFVQTFIFVALNKVITAQYFVWYLSLLPLCSHEFQITTQKNKNKNYYYSPLGISLAFLLLTVILWLGSAYCLEMQGWAVHRYNWLASLAFFTAEIQLLRVLIQSIPKQPTWPEIATHHTQAKKES